jgi:hypothetical protein
MSNGINYSGTSSSPFDGRIGAVDQRNMAEETAAALRASKLRESEVSLTIDQVPKPAIPNITLTFTKDK